MLSPASEKCLLITRFGKTHEALSLATIFCKFSLCKIPRFFHKLQSTRLTTRTPDLKYCAAVKLAREPIKALNTRRPYTFYILSLTVVFIHGIIGHFKLVIENCEVVIVINAEASLNSAYRAIIAESVQLLQVVDLIGKQEG